ncbi:MAG: pyrimidine dimer DNA glycosylase/endonuclease V [Sulfolobales archaeon]
MFRPYIDPVKSARFLDDRRLGKQRAETKQVIMIILRKLGVLRDGKRGWFNHPIVLMYYNNGSSYIKDLVDYFYATVEEWRRRGFTGSIGLSDISHLIDLVKGSDGTPITHVHEIEYRRVLLFKDPCYYYPKLSEEGLREIIETEPVIINGVNKVIRYRYGEYMRLVSMIKSNQLRCD